MPLPHLLVSSTLPYFLPLPDPFIAHQCSSVISVIESIRNNNIIILLIKVRLVRVGIIVLGTDPITSTLHKVQIKAVVLVASIESLLSTSTNRITVGAERTNKRAVDGWLLAVEVTGVVDVLGVAGADVVALVDSTSGGGRGGCVDGGGSAAVVGNGGGFGGLGAAGTAGGHSSGGG